MKGVWRVGLIGKSISALKTGVIVVLISIVTIEI